MRTLAPNESCEALRESRRIFRIARDFEDGHVRGLGHGQSSLAEPRRPIRLLLTSFFTESGLFKSQKDTVYKSLRRSPVRRTFVD